jgi:hypothetical protein
MRKDSIWNAEKSEIDYRTDGMTASLFHGGAVFLLLYSSNHVLSFNFFLKKNGCMVKSPTEWYDKKR